jgi:hypothetical protein
VDHVGVLARNGPIDAVSLLGKSDIIGANHTSQGVSNFGPPSEVDSLAIKNVGGLFGDSSQDCHLDASAGRLRQGFDRGISSDS